MLTSSILFLYGFIATGLLLSRVFIGPMPLYFIDILSILVILTGYRHMGPMFRRHKKISIVTLLFMASLLPTTFAEYFRMGFMEPTYLLLRTLLYIVAIWSLSGFLSNSANMKRFLLGVAFGVLVTGTIATLNSLPVTGPWMRAHVFTIGLLYPQRGGTSLDSGLMMLLDGGLAVRGDSLMGKSNVTGTMLITMLPFIIGMIGNMKLNPLTRTIINIISVIAIIGLLSTYSRLTYLAIAVLSFSYYLLDRKVFVRRFIPVLSFIAAGILFVGINSAFFKFEFIIDKFDLTNEQYEGTNMARLYAYTRPIQLVVNDPSYLVRGAGRAHRKLREEQKKVNILVLKDGEMHSVFAASIFWRGFLAMFFLFYLYFLLIKQTYRSMRIARQTRDPNAWLATSAFISLMALLSPWAFEHHMISSLSGHTILFMHFAVVIACIDCIKTGAENPRGEPPDQLETAKTSRILHYASKQSIGTSG